MPRKNYGPKLVKRGRIFYAEYFDRERGYTTRVSLGTEDREEAEEKFAEVGITATNPVRRSLKSINVDFLVAKYYTEVAKDFPSRYTYKAAMDHVNHAIPGKSVEWFAERPNQMAFVKSLKEEGLADATCQRIVASVSRALNWGYQMRMIREKPYVITVKAGKTRDRILSDDEARALINACETENERRLIALLLLTGSRPQALMDAHRKQFDRDNRLIYLNPEGREQNDKKYRPVIPMCDAIYTLCESWKDGPVFLGKSDHNAQLKEHRYLWNAVHIRAKLPKDVTAYTCRHTVATELRKQGVPEWDVSGYLGHRAPGSGTTARYAHWRPDFMRSAAEAMDTYWRRLNGTADLDARRTEERSNPVGQG